MVQKEEEESRTTTTRSVFMICISGESFKKIYIFPFFVSFLVYCFCSPFSGQPFLIFQ